VSLPSRASAAERGAEAPPVETATPTGAGLVELRPPGARQRPRRRGRDRSQALRRGFQIAFVALNAWIGFEFYRFVRYFETGGRSPWSPRPPGVEGWLPIASLMNLKATLLTGEMPRVFPAGVVLLSAFLAISLLFRKAFCSWLCPVGTLSEWLWMLGRRVFGRNLALPRWLDIPLRGVKYLLLGFFLWVVGSMSVEAIRAFLITPYGLVADVKMLDFFRRMGTTAAWTLAALVVLSIPVQNFWCRYACPYGALLGLVSMLAPLRVRRDPVTCIDCEKCAKACPSLLPVDRLPSVRSPECTGCLECVAACPVKGALDFASPRRRPWPAWAVAAGIATVFLGLVGAAQLAGHWRTDLPPEIYFQLVPRASEFGHP
jgi:polyferredoxin